MEKVSKYISQQAYIYSDNIWDYLEDRSFSCTDLNVLFQCVFSLERIMQK